MKICVVCCCLDNYKELAKITLDDNRRKYCERHGYDLKIVDWLESKFDSSVHGWGITWTRLDFIRNLMDQEDYDWIWCSGTDAMVTNLTIPLTNFIDPEYGIVVSCEWCSPIQADSMLFKCSTSAAMFLDEVLSKFEQFKNDAWVEQAAMIQLLPKWQTAIKILPQRAMNSYEYSLYRSQYPNCTGKDWLGQDGQWKPGDFFLHWPGVQLKTRLEQINRISSQIVK